MRMKVSDWEIVEHELPAEDDWKFAALQEHIRQRTRGKRYSAVMAIGIPTTLLRDVLRIIAKHDLTQYRRETGTDPETGERYSREVPYTIDIPVED